MDAEFAQRSQDLAARRAALEQDAGAGAGLDGLLSAKAGLGEREAALLKDIDTLRSRGVPVRWMCAFVFLCAGYEHVCSCMCVYGVSAMGPAKEHLCV